VGGRGEALEATLRGHTARVACLAALPGGRWLVTGDNDGSVLLWDLDKPALQSHLFDPTATASGTKGIAYDVYDQVTGRWVTYTLPCGSPIPPGAVCTCNCVPGSYSPPAVSRPSGRSRPGGTWCSCNKVCTCVPVYRPSSRRFKRNVRPVEAALDKLERVRGVSFDWTADAPGERAGRRDVG